MIKIPLVKKNKLYIWESLAILVFSILFFASLATCFYLYIFVFRNTPANKSRIENAYQHPYTYPKYQFGNLLKLRLFGQSE